MRDRLYVPLWMRMLLIAAANLAMLGVLCVVFLHVQLRSGLDSFVLAGARERIASVAQAINAELRRSPGAQWDAILSRYSGEHGVSIRLYRNTGEQLAGPVRALPPEVDALMPRGPAPSMRAGAPRASDATSGTFLAPGPPWLAIASSEPHYWVGVRMSVTQDNNPELIRTVLLLTSPTFFTNPFFFDLKPWLAIIGAAVVISVLCWLPLMRNLTRSIADMTQATAQIAEGRFAVSLSGDRRDELGTLLRSITQMATRLGALTEGRRRFLGDVAHELRSPLARMQLATDLLERTTAASDAHYIADLRDDVTVMIRLTDELLQIARAEGAMGTQALIPINVADAVRAAVRRESVEGIDLRIEVDVHLMVCADQDYLVRALANILRNAVWYAGDRGPIVVSAGQIANHVEIRVTDSGPGVPEASRDQIFAPFYRLDDARARQTGGTGLGLAIVRTCIEACGGTVWCHNRQPTGLDVTIRLPIAS